MAALSLTPEDILAENGLMEEPNCLPWEGRERKNSPQRYQRGRRGSEDEEKGYRSEARGKERGKKANAEGARDAEKRGEERAKSRVRSDCVTDGLCHDPSTARRKQRGAPVGMTILGEFGEGLTPEGVSYRLRSPA
ncbi:MAG TPA: hypothetical protein VFB30_17870 [Spirochaetia bacterium]|nr:hypothetical protein [Spirochaetia bacterium]